MRTGQIYYESELDDDKEYLTPETGEKKSGFIEAICNIFKSQVGATMLAIPFSMQMCGIGYGIIIQLLTTLFMLYGVKKLVAIADDVQKPKLYYPELVEQILGHKAGVLMGIILASLSLGGCIAYIIFFKSFIQEAFYYAGGQANQFEVITITLVILVPFIFVHNFHLLNRSSAFAIMIMLFTITYVTYYDAVYIEQNEAGIQIGNMFKFQGIPQFIGIAIFATEGITCVFHIRDSMEKPKYFMRVFTGSVVLILILYIIFGIINILTFGMDVNEIILMNIPYTNMASFFAKIGYATGILLTYPVQIFPVYSMVEKTALSFPKHMKIEDLAQIDIYKIYGLRLSVMTSVLLVAYVIPKFAGILNVLGSISGIVSQFVFPLIMDNVYQGSQKPRYLKYIDSVLIVLSCLLTVICGYYSIRDLLA